MKNVLTPMQMRATDKNTEYNHIPTIVLMENAGSKIADYIINNYPEKKKVSIYSGTGGNGGDGFVIARHLLNHGYKVRLFLLSKPENIKNKDSKQNYESTKIIAQTDKNLKLSIITDSSQVKPDNSDVIVDAILGTGVNGKLREPVSSVVDTINYSPAIVISVDVPSGMNPENGLVTDKCVAAHETLTLHKMKQGLSHAQESYVGKITVLDIGIPRVSEEYVGMGDLLLLKKPAKDSHKGQNGSVLIIGSNPDYIGAVVFAARAALSRRIDLVYIVAPEPAAKIIKQYSPEFIVRSVPGNTLSLEAYDSIMQLEKRVDSILIGSGSGTRDETCDLFRKVMQNTDKKLVIDADALKIISREDLSENMLVTPHANEFKQLFGDELPKDLDERIELITKLSAKYDCQILLKGVTDIIASPDDYKLNRTGNQGMTKGGTGDLLAGLTVAISTNNTLFESAFLSAFILGSAADKLLEEKGFNYGIEDILKKLEGN